MANVLIEQTTMTNIANAIRAKNGSSDTYKPAQMPTAISNLNPSSSLQSKSVSYTPSETAQSGTVTADNGYDGLSSVAVSVGAISSTYIGSGVTRKSAQTYTPTTSSQTIASGQYLTGAQTINPIPSEYIIPSGDLSITSNGNVDVSSYATATVSVSGGQSMNVQIAAGVNRIASSSYTAVSGQELTVAVTGTYDVYWVGYRSSTSGTSGSQLYIGSTAYGSANTTFSNNGQSVHLSNVSLTKNQVVSVRARARSSSYYMYVGNLTIIQSS